MTPATANATKKSIEVTPNTTPKARPLSMPTVISIETGDNEQETSGTTELSTKPWFTVCLFQCIISRIYIQLFFDIVNYE